MIVRLDDLEALLKRLNQSYFRLGLSNGICVLVTSLGGRVLGPFVDGVDHLGWVPNAFNSIDGFQSHVSSRVWNLGGERLWISPELTHFVQDRERFWDTFVVPDAVDPGHYQLQAERESVELTQDIVLNPSKANVEIERTISVSEEQVLPMQTQGIRSAGYRQIVAIASNGSNVPVVPWIIRQTSPGGCAIVPVDFGSSPITMFGNPEYPAGTSNAGAIQMTMTCKSMYKIGVPASCAHGLVGYFSHSAEQSRLLVSKFSHDRNGIYHDEPPACRGVSGMSTFLFQDDGSFGNYGELEMVGTDLGVGCDGVRRGFLSVDTWIYAGKRREIEKVAKDLRDINIH